MIFNYHNFYQEELNDGSLYPHGYFQRAPFDHSVCRQKESFTIVADGCDQSGRFLWVETKEEVGDYGQLRTIIRFVNDEKTLQADVVTEQLNVSDVEQKTMARYMTITNLQKDRALSLTDVQLFGGMIFQHSGTNPLDDAYRVGYFHEGAPGTEGDFHWDSLSLQTLEVANQTYTERYRLPFVVVHDQIKSAYVLMNLAFSGGYAMKIEHAGSGAYGQSNVSVSVRFGGKSPIRVLAPGEQATTPRLLLTYVEGSFDDAVQANIDFVRVCGGPWDKTQAIEVSTMTNEEEDVQFMLEHGRRMGAEVAYIDAGWYIPKGKSIDEWFAYCGDWQRPIDTYASSLHDFREKSHQYGMKFGLWMDVEKMGFHSQTVKEGSLSYLTDYQGHPIQDGPAAYMADLTDDHVLKWVFDQICYVIDTYQLEYFRLDSGVYATEAQHNYCGLRENAAWRYYDHLYDLFKKLRTKYPNVIFQNCAGGGMRADVGMTSIMSNTWISDVNAAPYSFRVINGLSMMIPVDYCVKILNQMGAETGCTDYFKLNVCRFGSPLIPSESRYVTDEFVKHMHGMLDMYRKYIRPILPTCRVIHHTPDISLLQDGELGVLEIASKDASCAMVCAFTLGPVDESKFVLTFKGVKNELNYDVYANDQLIGEMTGKALLSGVPIEIEEMNDSICLIAVAQG